MNIELQQLKTAKALLAAMTALPLTLNRVLLPAVCRDTPSQRPPAGVGFPLAARTPRSNALTPLTTVLMDCQADEDAATFVSVSQKDKMGLMQIFKQNICTGFT